MKPFLFHTISLMMFNITKFLPFVCIIDRRAYQFAKHNTERDTQDRLGMSSGLKDSILMEVYSIGCPPILTLSKISLTRNENL